MKTKKPKLSYLVEVDLYDLGNFKILKKPIKKGEEPYPFKSLEDALKHAIVQLEDHTQMLLAEAEDLENEADEVDFNKQVLIKKLEKIKKDKS